MWYACLFEHRIYQRICESSKQNPPERHPKIKHFGHFEAFGALHRALMLAIYAIAGGTWLAQLLHRA
jgi:hypothetical protein